MEKINQIVKLTNILNKASAVYYNTGSPTLDDKKFDALLDKLKELEEETGFTLSNSPTHNVGTKVLPCLNKITHKVPMLSLDKCHTIEELVKFAENDNCYLSLKYDGLSTRLVFENGQLVSAATRGNGIEGTDILEHVKHYDNIPTTIAYKERLVIDGESCILDQDFRLINSKLPKDKQFKNSRNLASGTLNSLDTSVVKERHMKFFAWRVIEGFDYIPDSNFFKLKEAQSFGFEVGEIFTYTNLSDDKDNIKTMVEFLQNNAKQNGIQIDGIVMAKDSIKLCNQLGRTEKFFRHSIAYKFEDEVYETKLLDIEWTVGRSSVIVPTAVFEPVEIDGTIVEKASVHNVSILTQFDLHVGDIIEVYKANQIIPQVHRNISAENRIDMDYIRIPGVCPVCDGDTEIKDTENSKILVCTNPDCPAKKLAQFTHFVSRNCANINGLSEKLLEKLITGGLLYHYNDIYHLKAHKARIIMMDGLGKKSAEKLLEAIEASRNIKLENFIAALGIDGIGLSAAKTIAKYFNHNPIDWYQMGISQQFNYTLLDDFGATMMQNIWDFAERNKDMVVELMGEMNFIIPEKVEVKENLFTGKNICVTGKLNHFTRNSINEKIASLGAKAVSSVSSKTDYLINNDVESTSSKNKKAKELNIPIITEEQFIEMIGE